VVLLAFVEVAIAVALFVVGALGKVVVFLILLVSPPGHHVTEVHGSSQAVAPEVVVRVFQEEAMLEIAVDVLIGDVGDGGTRLKEKPCVGQFVASARPDHGSLEVVDEGPHEVLPRVDRVWLETFKPCEGCRLQSHREVESFYRVGSP
jgi:hypothetical protein